MKEIKLLSLDMDGTTYFRMGEIVPANLDPIKKAIKQGVEVVFVTGRPPLARLNKLEEHGLASKNTLIVAYNGAAIYSFDKKQVIKSNPIDSQTALKIFSLVEKPEFKDTILWGYVDDLKTVVTNVDNPQLSVDKPEKYIGEMKFFDGQYLESSKILNNFNYQFFKVLVFNSNPDFLNELKKMGLEIASADGIDAEVNAKDINKKSAVEWLSQQLKIPVENIMAIGDGANDLSMIEYAGVGVALKNSIPVVQQKADLYIDLTNEEGAVGFVIENYILKKEKE